MSHLLVELELLEVRAAFAAHPVLTTADIDERRHEDGLVVDVVAVGGRVQEEEAVGVDGGHAIVD